MPDTSPQDPPNPEQPPAERPGGTANLFPDLPPELTPSTLDRDLLTAQEQDTASQALAHLQEKMIAVSVELAQGKLNQAQFQAIYTRYSEQKILVEKLVAKDPATKAWRDVTASGVSGILRRRYAAHVIGMLVVEMQTGETLRKLGDFTLARELLVPILAGLVDGKAPAFEAGARSTQIEGGRWLGFVPGEYSASIAIFSQEPPPAQIAALAEAHRSFEQLNRNHLMSGSANAAQLEYPQRNLFDEGT